MTTIILLNEFLMIALSLTALVSYFLKGISMKRLVKCFMVIISSDIIAYFIYPYLSLVSMVIALALFINHYKNDILISFYYSIMCQIIMQLSAVFIGNVCSIISSNFKGNLIFSVILPYLMFVLVLVIKLIMEKNNINLEFKSRKTIALLIFYNIAVLSIFAFLIPYIHSITNNFNIANITALAFVFLSAFFYFAVSLINTFELKILDRENKNSYLEEKQTIINEKYTETIKLKHFFSACINQWLYI